MALMADQQGRPRRTIADGLVGLGMPEPQENHLLMEEDTPLSPSEMTPRQWSWGAKASLERARTLAVDSGMGQHSTTSALQSSFASSASRNLQAHASSASRSYPSTAPAPMLSATLAVDIDMGLHRACQCIVASLCQYSIERPAE